MAEDLSTKVTEFSGADPNKAGGGQGYPPGSGTDHNIAGGGQWFPPEGGVDPNMAGGGQWFPPGGGMDPNMAGGDQWFPPGGWLDPNIAGGGQGFHPGGGLDPNMAAGVQGYSPGCGTGFSGIPYTLGSGGNNLGGGGVYHINPDGNAFTRVGGKSGASDGAGFGGYGCVDGSQFDRTVTPSGGNAFVNSVSKHVEPRQVRREPCSIYTVLLNNNSIQHCFFLNNNPGISLLKIKKEGTSHFWYAIFTVSLGRTHIHKTRHEVGKTHVIYLARRPQIWYLIFQILRKDTKKQTH